MSTPWSNIPSGNGGSPTPWSNIKSGGAKSPYAWSNIKPSRGGGAGVGRAAARQPVMRGRANNGLQKGPAYDPMAELLKFAQGAGSWEGGSGGSAGSPGNGAMIRQMVAQIENNKRNAAQRYANNRAQVTDIYGQLRDSLKPNAGLTKARYDGTIAAAKTAGGNIAAEANQQMTENATERDAALASLGIDEGALLSEEQEAVADSNADLAATNASWGNMMGVMSNAQQSRDQLDVQGAGDAGVLANRELTNNYEDYIRALEQQVAEAWAQYVPPSGGSGGSPGRYRNPLMDTLNEAIFGKMMGEAGLGEQGEPAPDWGALGGFGALLGNGVNPTTNKGYSNSELLALALQSSQNPSQVQSLIPLWRG